MPALSIIIPCYNEELRLDPTKFIDFLNEKSDINMVFVDDASLDDTENQLQKIKATNPDRVKIIKLPARSGKGEAVRLGLIASVENSTIKYHGFMDADHAVSLKEFYRLYQKISNTDKLFLIGSRVKKIGASIKRNEWRHFYSRIIATIVGSIIKLDVYDTQCSAKIFNSSLVSKVFLEKFRTKWLFDVEIICRINKNIGDLNSFGIEEPLLEWSEIKGSKLQWFNLLQILKEVLLLKKHYRAK